MIDHVGLYVKNLQIAKEFYQKALEPLGYQLSFENEAAVSFVKPYSPHPGGDFWLGIGDSKPIHLAFLAQSQEQVDEFYQAGLLAGGKDNGAPGLRESYHPPYYAAFIIDPDENNIAVVCHK